MIHPTAEDSLAAVLPLLRDLNLPTELAPAMTPAGSGAEVSEVRQVGLREGP
jgi:hypothetical protein